MLLSEIFNNLLPALTDPERLINIGGWVLLTLVIYIETGFLIGMFLPGGDYTLFTAGLLCGTAILTIPIYGLIPTLIIASFLGDLTGFQKDAGWVINCLPKKNPSFSNPRTWKKPVIFTIDMVRLPSLPGNFFR